MSRSASLYPIKGLYYCFQEENRAILWQRVSKFALEVGVSSAAIMGTLVNFTFDSQREMLNLVLPSFLYLSMGTIALIMIETAIPTTLLFYNRHQTIYEKLFLDVLQLQGVTVERASPKEHEWIQEHKEIRRLQMQAQATGRQTLFTSLPAILTDPEAMTDYPKLKYFITFPVHFIPIIGQALFCWLNSMEAATCLHHYYYLDLKGLSPEEEAIVIHFKKEEYISFGVVASALAIIPGLNVILILTNAIGAALWIADIEKAIQKQH